MQKDPNQKGTFSSKKDEQLEQFRVEHEGAKLTTNQGLPVSEDEHSLKAGERGPTLMEDFHFREKMTHFDHERIPERVVHARGFGAHGYFQVYEPMAEYTKAKFLQDPSVKTPVFVRFSTVAGSRGSADSVRDVRGFATKFYTEEGVYDLVGNNIPIFFIQDAIKFPDLVHSFKPEPHNEMPQASTAHDTFWDFVANNTESAHMIMWNMSDRAIPRSYRMMEGFGVHTFRFINEQGKARFVKFHWKPVLGVHSFVWDEAHELAGRDPDFHRRDLWEAIEMGDYPEFELGVQIIEEEGEFKFDFDILDPTKIWPEEMVPVKLIGKMTLNRNQDNVFAETEQAAFHPGHVVPGIDFSNDPLLQGRLFSYTDTQLIRLGGPNFHQIPINRSVSPVRNHQRDGYHQMNIDKGKVSYHKNGLRGNDPHPVPEEQGGYAHYQEKVEGRKVRQRSDSFKDHYSQAKLFWNSMTDVEKQHIVEAFHFELGKVQDKNIRQQVVNVFANVDEQLAARIAAGIGAEVPKDIKASTVTLSSPAVSQEQNKIKSAATRKVGILAADGYDDSTIEPIMQAFKQAGVHAEVISGHLGMITGVNGEQQEVKHSFLTAESVLFDALYVACGEKSVEQLKKNNKAVEFLKDAFKHFKTIGAAGKGAELLITAGIQAGSDPGIVINKDKSDWDTFGTSFINAIAEHRHWERQV
ncbi:catalase [Bacillus thermotolerans]|uniref:catalase n=1 Tax=Bacillus thermotolerans TaxID=1221996 RepID=UPI00057F3B78|nr:catalase [Bacillus thermotolerans]KKB36923.1 Catalase [Bacillus thermotolerans]